MENTKRKSTRIPTLFVANFNVNDGDQETIESPNKAKLVDLIKKTIKERAGESGCGYFEIRKVYTTKEREKLSIPDNIHGMIDQRTRLINGKWETKTPFKEYF